MLRSIRTRLIASYVLLTLLTVSVVGLLALWAVRRYAEQQQTNALNANARAIASQALPLIWPRPSAKELDRLAELGAFFGDVRVRILDADRKLIADSGQPGQADSFAWVILPPEIGSRLYGRPVDGWVVGMFQRQRAELLDEIFPFAENLPSGASITVIRNDPGPWGSRLFFYGTSSGDEPGGLAAAPPSNRPRSDQVARVPIGDPQQPAGYVVLSAPADYSPETLATARQALALAGGGALLLAGLIGLFMGRRLTRPLTQLSAATAEMSAGNLTARAQVHSSDEIGDLAEGFNHMAEQLQTSFVQLADERDALRRFVADASHELRTPITALKNFNDLLLNAAADDPAAREEFLLESRVQIDRLAWITQNLLDISRLDAGLAGLDMEAVSLQELIQEALGPYRPQAQEKDLTFNLLLPPEPVAMICDRARMVMSLSNLLDNAIKFSPPGGTITVGASMEAEAVRIWVEDGGPGIREEELPHIFERFYRGRDQSAAASRTAGHGLGLAIVKSVMQAHGGQVHVENLPEGGARFTLHSPINPQKG